MRYTRRLALIALLVFVLGASGCQSGASAEPWPTSEDTRVRLFYFGSPG